MLVEKGYSLTEGDLYELTRDLEQDCGFNPDLAKGVLKSGYGDIVGGALRLLRGAMNDGWSIAIPPVLLDSEVRKAIDNVETVGKWDKNEALNLYQETLDQHFTRPLTEIAQGRQPTAEEIQMLVETLQVDEVQRAILDIPAGQTAEDVVWERIAIMQKVWPDFSAWWRSYLPQIPVLTDSLWRVYIPFSQWTIEQVNKKRQSRPEEIFIPFVYGNQGGGKTVFTRAILQILNALLDPYGEQAVARGFDDYYLGKEDREKLRRPGYYDPIPGVSNRGPAGTHDTAWILRNFEDFRRQFKPGAAISKVEMGNFDKGSDSQPANPLVVDVSKKKVRVFVLDNWFFPGLGFDINQVPEGFKHTHAETLLRDYKPIFDQVDAVWAFVTQPLDVIEANRQEQEDSRERRGEPRGMTREAISYFVQQYFYTDPWHWDPIGRTWAVTSPVPSEKNVTFIARTDANRRFVSIQRGGRSSA